MFKAPNEMCMRLGRSYLIDVLRVVCWLQLSNGLLEKEKINLLLTVYLAFYSPLDPDDNLSYTSWLHLTISLFEGNATH